MPTANRQHGFTILGLLFLIAGMGVAMAAVGTLWHTAAQREKEKDLLFAGDEYRRAITSFWQASPKGQERLPKNFAELLQDPRFPHTVRHLRRLYPEPMSGSMEWGIVKGADGGIAGVYSKSEGKPMKKVNFALNQADFAGAGSYREWVFIYGAGGVGGTGMPGDNLSVSKTSDATGKQTIAENDKASDSDRSEKIAACQKAMEQDYLECTAGAQGDAGRLHSCTDEMTEKHRACLGS